MACDVFTTIPAWRRSILLVLALTVPRLTVAGQLPSGVQSPPYAPVLLDHKEVWQIRWSLGRLKPEIPGKDGEVVAFVPGAPPVSTMLDGAAASKRVAKENRIGPWASVFERLIRAYRDARSTPSMIRGALLVLFILAAGFQRARLSKQKKTVTHRADMWRIASRPGWRPGTRKEFS